MSNYPPGSENDPRAPWNQKDPVMKECTNCDGQGVYMDNFYHSDGRPVEFEKVNCSECDGSGVVEMTDDEIEDAEGDRKYDSWKDSQLEDK